MLPIVPWWNWNQKTILKLDDTADSQSYRGGIEIYSTHAGRGVVAAPNRTVVELKSVKYLRVIEKVESPNRTVVELKCAIRREITEETGLPIVPWWNWNWFTKHYQLQNLKLPIVPWWNWNENWILFTWSSLVSQSYRGGIEMELKHRFVRSGNSPNRTVVELKWTIPPKREHATAAPNRTVVELKCMLSITSRAVITLPIVPWWNWNEVDIEEEKKELILPIVPWWNWNKGRKAKRRQGRSLPIVPWWNWNSASSIQFESL